MRTFWSRVVRSSLPFVLLLVLPTAGLVRCGGGEYVSGPEAPYPYNDEFYGGDDFDEGDFDENDEDDFGEGEEGEGDEDDEGEGADRD
jgi:hypothetical protein